MRGVMKDHENWFLCQANDSLNVMSFDRCEKKIFHTPREEQDDVWPLVGGVMSQLGGKSSIAIVDAKELRRTSITSLLEPWAKTEHLRLTSFSPDQAHEAIDAVTDLRMLIFSVGGDSIADHENLQQVKVLRALAPKVPLVIISDSDDVDDVAAAFAAQAQGFINSEISCTLAYQALSFIMNGGTYFPPSAMQHLKEQPE